MLQMFQYSYYIDVRSVCLDVNYRLTDKYNNNVYIHVIHILVHSQICKSNTVSVQRWGVE